jgi:hypothetical protein
MAQVSVGQKVLVDNLALPPGYRTEQSEAGVYLVDPDGRRVMRLPNAVLAEGHREDQPGEPTSKGYPELCRMLLVRLREKTAECERQGDRVAVLSERLEAVEAERDQASAIAEDLYDFFRRRVREVVDRGKESERGAH